MARSNQTSDFTRTITPINNCINYDVNFWAKPDLETMKPHVYYYPQPERDIYPDDKSFQDAMANWETNEEQYDAALNAGRFAMQFQNGNKKYLDDFTKIMKNGDKVQSFSGRLLNCWYIVDTMKDGKKKKKFMFDFFDFSTNERYEFTTTFTVLGRKFVDKLLSLSKDDLQHDIRVSFDRVTIGNRDNVPVCNVYVLDPAEEYNNRKVEAKFENSKWDADAQQSTALPKGTPKQNKEYLKGFKQQIEGEGNSSLLKFYVGLLGAFKKDVLVPLTTDLFDTMGYSMELQDQEQDKKDKKGKDFKEKSREVIFLTKIEDEAAESEAAESEAAAASVTTEEPPNDKPKDDLPF